MTPLVALSFLLTTPILASAANVATLMTSLNNAEAFPISPGFDVAKVADQAVRLASHSWEFGTMAEALLELYDKDRSVFGSAPFPVQNLDLNKIPSLSYAAQNIKMGSQANGLSQGSGSVGDPVSLGVAAVMLGKDNSAYTQKMEDTVKYLMNRAPRFYNGAISHRSKVPELWADWMYMVPPALAYYGADKGDASMIQEAVRQCSLYRQVLQSNVSSSVPYKGAWEHIIGPTSPDKGIWASGNGWAVGGMSRVLATVMKAPVAQGAQFQPGAISSLNKWIKEILDGVINSDLEDGLVRNYLNVDNVWAGGFGEISGSSMFAAVIYRMAILTPDTFAHDKYLGFADAIRKTIAGKDKAGNAHVTKDGIVTPAVNPLAWKDTNPFTSGSPEGQAFTVLMYSSWRDCVQLKTCKVDDRNFLTAATGAAPVCPPRKNRGLARRSSLLRHAHAARRRVH